MNIVIMGFRKFRSNLRNDFLLSLSLSFSILILFNFLMILFTDAFSDIREPDQSRIHAVISIASFILVCFLFFFIWYSTDIALERHKKESGIYVLMGLNSERAGRLYMAETFMMGLAVLLSGLFFGILTVQLFQMILGAVSEIRVELVFPFAAEPPILTAVAVLSMYAVFAVRGYKNILRSSVRGMIPASRLKEQARISPKGLAYRTVLGVGSLTAGFYLSVRSTIEEISTLLLAGILVTGGIYLVFGGMIPWLLYALAGNKRFLYRKERTLWINNAACRMRKNYRTYAAACVMMLCAVTGLTVGAAMKEWYGMRAMGPEGGRTAWIRMVCAVTIILFLLFVMAGGSAMLMKADSDALEEKERYDLLRRMGMSPEVFDRAVARELGIVYVCLFALTALSSIFSIRTLEKMLTVDLGTLYLVNVFLIFTIFILLYLCSVALYRKEAGNG